MRFIDLEILTKTVYGEARGEPREGKQAVVGVIRNRLNATDRWYSAGTYRDVCLKNKQFSCWNTNDPMRPKIETLAVEKAVNCLEAVLDVLFRGAPDPTGGATFYLNPSVLPKLPAWATKKPPVKI